ncbi:MAG: hypothetical protein JWO52_3645 [Gammaproteobacteria bacterium]|nr:hypothetical protein [Gammaproteobacteria bacterium]
MRRVTAGAPVLFALLALSACASRGESTGLDQTKAGRPAAIEQLTALGTADSLATAALLKQFGAETDDGSYALAARAVELAPGRGDLAWLAVRLCNIAADCDPAVPEQHLHGVDPGNGVASMGALLRAQAKNDVAAIDAMLTALGNSERFYVYFDPLVAATAPQLARVRHRGSGPASRKELVLATVEIIGVIAASVLPPLQASSSSCKGMALQLDGRLERCRRAAQAFEHADTFIVEGLGLSLQQRLWPLESTEGRAVTTRRRVFQYRLEEYSRLSISALNFSEFPTDVVDVFRAHEREQDAALVYFAKAGVPADPPTGWTSTSLPRVP